MNCARKLQESLSTYAAEVKMGSGGRIIVSVVPKHWLSAAGKIATLESFSFGRLLCLFGISYNKQIQTIAELETLDSKYRISFRTMVNSDEKLPSLAEVWPNAAGYEEEKHESRKYL